MKNKISSLLAATLFLCSCSVDDTAKTSVQHSTNDEFIIELSDSYESLVETAEEPFENAVDFFSTSENLSAWNVSKDEMYSLYKVAVSSDELMGHTLAFYDAIKDIDGNGDYEYLVASRFGFADTKDSLIVCDKASDNSIKIVYNSSEDTSLDCLEFQHITGHFNECPINSTTGLDGTLYKPVYNDGNFKLGDDNAFYTTRWSNIRIHNICYRIEYDGTSCELVKTSDIGWDAKVIYENEEPTNKCKVVYTDFTNNN